jgi:hypothetical protein
MTKQRPQKTSKRPRAAKHQPAIYDSNPPKLRAKLLLMDLRADGSQIDTADLEDASLKTALTPKLRG